jgi:poly-gamma-glutamate synthase PgsB/CapB
MSLFYPINYVFLVVLGCILAFLTYETVRLQIHLRNIRSIPHRIHINGSRGKSSVTRLIGAVLRASGKITVAKTTGTAPRFITPDGNEIPVFRPGKPNIIEQLRIVHHAKKHRAEVLAMECMAITPEYISILEDKIIKSNIGIMTNVREDHLDVMGPTLYDVATNMARSFPKNGIAFTAEKKWFSVLEKETKKRNSKLYQVSEDTVTDDEMKGFSYIEHKENVAIALAIGDHFGVPRKKAFDFMYQALPDPGVLRETVVPGKGGDLYFFNALAANDPDSSLMIWNKALQKRSGLKVVILILRKDRQQRTESYCRALGTTIRGDHYLIAGSPVAFIESALLKKGVSKSSIIALENPQGNEVAELLIEFIKSGSVVACAMGNIVGLGDAFLRTIEDISHTRKSQIKTGENTVEQLELSNSGGVQ